MGPWTILKESSLTHGVANETGFNVNCMYLGEFEQCLNNYISNEVISLFKETKDERAVAFEKSFWTTLRTSNTKITHSTSGI